MSRLVNAKIYAIPLGVFVVLMLLFWRGMSRDPKQIPSPLINQPVPKFSLPAVASSRDRFTDADLRQQVSLVHIWATWCYTCRSEYPTLVELAKEAPIPFYAITYRDKVSQIKAWVKSYSNPYRKIGVDEQGDTVINWGVYGTPETYLVDSEGIIRYKHVGNITYETWQEKILPEIKRYQHHEKH